MMPSSTETGCQKPGMKGGMIMGGRMSGGMMGGGMMGGGMMGGGMMGGGMMGGGMSGSMCSQAGLWLMVSACPSNKKIINIMSFFHFCQGLAPSKASKASLETVVPVCMTWLFKFAICSCVFFL